MSRCANHCKPDPPPVGFTLEAAAGHPSHRYALAPGAQCELDSGHDGPHRNGGLSWWDPVRIQVVGASDEQTARPPIAGGWRCRSCDRENPPNAIFCRGCAATQEDDPEPSLAGTGSGGKDGTGETRERGYNSAERPS